MALEVIARIQAGPRFSASPGTPFTPEEATAAYRLWAETWLVDDARYLLSRDLNTARKAAT